MIRKLFHANVLGVMLFLFPVFQTNAQNYIQQIDNTSVWKGQLKYNYGLIQRFENYCQKNNLLSGSIAMLNNDGEKLRNYTRTVDLNNDGLKDIVYSGPSGGEPNIVYFFLQTHVGFKQVFNIMQAIEKVVWKGQLLKQVFTSDWGCCGSIQLNNCVYDVKYNTQNVPIFTKVFQSIEVDEKLVKPKNYFPAPIQFNVDNEGYKLRLSPIIDKTTKYEELNTKGNAIATLKKGTIGKALASKVDKTGRVWWYVSIPFDNNVQNCILSPPDKFKTYIIGWLSSRYVTKIKN